MRGTGRYRGGTGQFHRAPEWRLQSAAMHRLAGAMRTMVLISALTLVPTALAAGPSCNSCKRCIAYFQQSMCLEYNGLPGNYTEEERAMAALRGLMEQLGCAVPERRDYREACDAVIPMRFSEDEGGDCAKLAAP